MYNKNENELVELWVKRSTFCNDKVILVIISVVKLSFFKINVPVYSRYNAKFNLKISRLSSYFFIIVALIFYRIEIQV